MPNFIRRWFGYNLLNTQTRLLLFLTIAIFLIILIVSITSYKTSKSVLQEQLNDPQQQMLQISMNFIDEAIKESDRSAIEVALNDHVYRFLTSNMQKNPYENITEIYKLLSTLIDNSSIIKSIYIYDIDKGSFVTIPQGYSSTKMTFIDSEWTSVAAADLNEKMMVVKKRDVPEGAKNSGSAITLFRKIMIQGEFKGIVAINLKEAELFAKINPSELTNLNSMRFIIDEQKEVLYSTSNYPFDKAAIEYGLSELRRERLGDFTYKGETLLASQLQSSITGWQYVSLVTQDSILAKSRKVGSVVFLVSLIALFIGAIVIIYINVKVFRPVFRLKQLFRTKGQDMSHHDLSYLENLAGELLYDRAHLSKLLDAAKAEASSKFIYDIYRGNIKSGVEIREKWGGYFKEWNNESLIAAIISIDNFTEWGIRFPNSDHSLLKFALKNIISEVLTDRWYNECVDFGKDKIAILLQPNGSDEVLYHDLMKALSISERLLGFSASVGISYPKTEPEEIQGAVFEAETALGYRLYKGYGSVIKISDCKIVDHNNSTVKDNALEQLSESMIGGDVSRSLKIVEDKIQKLRNNQFLPSIALSLLNEMRSVIWNRGQEKHIDNIEQQAWNRKLESISLDDVEMFLRKGVIEETEKKRVFIQNKEIILCEKMITYMKEHLNEAIGITEIADSTEISVSLASQIFKEKTDETIYGYFTRLRIERAEELLLNTDEKVSSIAFKVGYQHENSFIRVFRKYKNITPGKYREMLKDKKRTIG